MTKYLKICPHNGAPKKLIKVSSLADVLEKGIEKLNLPSQQYKILLEDDGTIFDVDVDDEIFMDMANKSILTLKLVPEDMPDPNQTTNVIADKASDMAITSSSTSVRDLVDFRSELLCKFPTSVLSVCREGQFASNALRRKVIASMADYIVDDLKDQRRKTSFTIAEEICKKYPKSFEDSIEGVVVGTGWDTLGNAIYTAVIYRMKDKNGTKRKRIEMAESDDESAARISTLRSLRKEDEYGCVAYNPIVDEEELAVAERKRLKLIEEYEKSVTPTPEIMKLLKETYPLQRKHILAHADIKIVFSKWPYLRHHSSMFQHMEILVGKENIRDQWRSALEKYAKPIRKFLKVEETIRMHKKKNDVPEGGAPLKTMINEAKNAAHSVTRSEIPLVLVIFRLIVHHFQENEDDLFLLEEENLTDEQILQKIPNLTPVLIIKGRSLYDENVTCAVAMDKKVWIPVNGVYDGILLTFSLYFAFAVLYPDTLPRTLEFIQRCFLKINPKEGHKRASKKQKLTPFDLKVKKFIDGLQNYVEERN